MRGTVTDAAGETLPGANVVATHLPTGSEYGAATNAQGTFNLRNLRVGGPYRVEVTFVGFEPFVREDVSLTLGEVEQLDVELSEDFVIALDGVEVTAARAESERNGVATSIDEERISNTPTVGRDLADFARLTPQAYVENDDDDGPSISIAGQNNRYNSIFIDGAVSNDVFGLSAQGTDGGQTGSTPVSVDAIEAFQINISPFDVTQSGFTGGSINAVTRSGTNAFEGSAYYFVRDEALAGRTPTSDPDAQRELLPNFSNDRFGLRLGGPIVQDRLFFFVNAERLRSSTPQPFVETYIGDSFGRVGELQAALQAAGFDPGAFGDKASSLDSDKLLVKLDWNVSQQHKLSVRHNYAQADNVDAFASGRFDLNFTANNEVFPNETNTTTLELSSTLGSGFANRFLASYKTVRDDRGFASNPFPFVSVEDGAGDINFGSEQFSTANVLEQDVITVTNDVNGFYGQHTFTLGANFEYYDIGNLFIPRNFGFYEYESLDGFLQSLCASLDDAGSVEACAPFGADPQPVAPAQFRRGFSLVDDDPSTREIEDVAGDASNSIGAFEAYTIGVYVQDEFQLNDRVRFTGGLRLDVPTVTSDPRFAPDVFDTTIPLLQSSGVDLAGARPGESPSAQFLFSPRLGFNLDVAGDGRTQVRGGLGVFTGRVPFVWAGGAFLNNGANTGEIRSFSGALPDGSPIPFRPDPQNALNSGDFITDADLDTDGDGTPDITPRDLLLPSGRLEIFEEDFKFPRVFRTSLGVDHQLPYGIVGTLEGQYTNTLQNILVTNVNLRPEARVSLDGPDNRPVYFPTIDLNGDTLVSEADLVFDNRYSAIHRVGNTSEGYTYDVTAALQRDFGQGEIPFFDALFARVSYTYGDAFSVNDGTSSQINSLWAGTETVDGPNNLDLTRSDFSLGHRALASLTLGKGGTTVTAFLNLESGRPFSYTIDDSDDMLGAGTFDVGLLYVPENASDLTFQPITDPDGNVTVSAEAQAEALDAFISNNDYLSERRGQYAERNADRTPFETALDLNIRQELFQGLPGRLEVTLDIANLTNLINSDWGRRYAGIGTMEVLEFQDFADAEAGDLTPVYEYNLFDRDGDLATDVDEVFQDAIIQSGTTYSSRWQMQLGVRYTF